MERGQSSDSTDLPDDWWRYTSTAEALSAWFIQHLLVLVISFKREHEGQTHHAVYTGFLLYHNDFLFWVTAGHVVDEVQAILSDPDTQVLRMRWLDGCGIPGAESVPVGHELMSFSSYGQGIDFGIVHIPGLEALNIVEGGRVKLITAQIWKSLDSANPDGYYILGYPKEWTNIREEHLSDTQIRGSIRADLAILPVKRIEYPGPEPARGRFWNDPDAFYGQILPFVDDPGSQPDSIVGMSGGPILSVERDPDGRIRYRLFGIQSSWLRSERTIRAEPIQRIVAILTEG